MILTCTNQRNSQGKNDPHLLDFEEKNPNH